MKKISLLVFCLGMSLFFSACNPSKVDIDKVKVTDLSGQNLDWKQYKGKVIFLHFWATWCRDCLKEMPQLVQMAEAVKNDPNIIFVFASDEPLENIKTFSEGQNLPFLFVKLPTSLKENGIIYIPQTYIFDKKGKIVKTMGEKARWETEKDVAFLKDLAK
jgi:thiol-disulfide isomerase/thioredoxin